MSRNIGIGTSAKLVMAPKPLFSTCPMPFAPPMKSMAATILEARKAIAIGMPSSISATISPKSSATAQYHSIGPLLFALGQPGAVRALAAHKQPGELDRHHAEGQRHRRHQHPARHVERAHVLLVGGVVLQRD